MRAFIAIDIPEGIRKRLYGMEGDIPGSAAIVAERNLHVTLQFIGEIDEKRVASVVEALRSIKAQPFKINIIGVSYFAKGDDVHVVYADVQDGGMIKSMYSQLSAALLSKGISLKEEREYVPHVTLARPKRASVATVKKFIEDHKNKDFGSFEVTSISLKKSTITGNGPVYETLYEAELA